MLFATVASICTSPEELTQTMFAAMLPLIIAFVSTFYVTFNPGTLATRVLSLLPPFTPLVMLARINVLPPPTWEIWLGVALLIAGIVAAGLFSVAGGGAAAAGIRYHVLLLQHPCRHPNGCRPAYRAADAGLGCG